LALTDKNLENRICLITGATSGIGMVTAIELACMGSIVVITARTAQKAKVAVEKIIEESGNLLVEGLVADLSSQADVRALAGEFMHRYQRCDVLVNNAGAVFLRRSMSSDGIEMTFALNHLAPFLLTNLLLDTIKRSAPARIVNVASHSHEGAEINFSDLEGKHGYSFMRAYGQSKLANVMFTIELARRLNGVGVTVNAVHPGFVATNMGANNGWLVRLFLPLTRLWAISPQEGAKTIVYLATSPEVEGVSGKYFYKNRAVPSSPVSQDRESAQRLWAVSAKMVGL
jgi:NAD(P)-dependent dehydrogenase (short-subunit alcohol dehydrogenase family)